MNIPTQNTLPILQIVQGKNPREFFDPKELARLEEGLRAADGVLQPIVVRPKAGECDIFEIVAGERRWRAAKNVFGDTYAMPVVIRALNDTDAEAVALIENHHRADMSHAEEAQAARRQLMRLRGDRQEAAKSLGWSIGTLERRLALLACTPEVLAALTRRQIQLGHAELLAGVPPGKQNSVLEPIIERGISVAILKTQLGRFARRLADAIFDTAGCAACPHNSGQQAGLFDESLGDGFCQHPTHYDELTEKAVEAKADTLREQYPTVKIVRATDGFTPLPLAADGPLGVGSGQYGACKGCASFGCAVSAMAGSHGDVTHSLCFNAACNSRKVSAWRKAARSEKEAGTANAPAQAANAAARQKTPVLKPAATTVPQRILDFRLTQWRRWAARELMTNTDKNRRVLIALARAGQAGDVGADMFAKTMNKLTGTGSEEKLDFAHALRQVDKIDAAYLDRLTLAVAAAAAFGASERHLVALLNYLGIDERRHFQLSEEFLALHTLSELEALAGETGLRTAMGVGYKLARGKKKPDFIAALLSVPGLTYEGRVPAVMRYPRAPEIGEDENAARSGEADDGTAGEPENAEALAA
ncbi:MAG: PRTRC system ParB family protein [Azoarcus sp.]|jgi:PRTRC genetic system ParB family protein|nr:PRTRC system ParB family protein [Azoarcus sp.]